MTHLLDVNVLIALFDPDHLHNAQAQCWFSGRGNSAWATCPITENGLVRIVSGPGYPLSITPEQAAAKLRKSCQGTRHEFWMDDLSLRDTSIFDLSPLQGHQQITDAYLAAIAFRHGAKLATFDKNIPFIAVRGATANLLEVIPT